MLFNFSSIKKFQKWTRWNKTTLKKSLWLDEISLGFNCSNWVKQAGQSAQFIYWKLWSSLPNDHMWTYDWWSTLINDIYLMKPDDWLEMLEHVLQTLISHCDSVTLIRDTCPLTIWSFWPWSLRHWCGSRRSSANLHWSGKRRCFDHASLPIDRSGGSTGWETPTWRVQPAFFHWPLDVNGKPCNWHPWTHADPSETAWKSDPLRLSFPCLLLWVPVPKNSHIQYCDINIVIDYRG